MQVVRHRRRRGPFALLHQLRFGVAAAWDKTAKEMPRSFDQATERLKSSFKSLFKSVETDANNTTLVIDRIAGVLDKLKNRAKENIKESELSNFSSTSVQ